MKYDTDPTEYGGTCDKSKENESRLAIAWLRKVVQEHTNKPENGENGYPSHEIRFRPECTHTVHTFYNELMMMRAPV
ncbi:hypothetical protein GCM10009066_02540 [Halarchaeum salinum]|uniref:Uncharacterized protein n=1 Tax=Halarchaeum salinum TaxID=489912 RepID=A0AAV3S2X7_9EURY